MLQVLRVAQEALTNVLKHAHATQVGLRLRKTEGMLELQIEDNGRGAGDEPPAHGRGMDNMRTRAKRLGGRFSVRSSSLGTSLVLQVPLAAPAL